ncbi:HAD family hydrolase [Bifidobacterium xylocopae]|uniref:HAD family hydrolase n=1 Tax=Bifidobacterium xylocopae TaxID=2493119 RepID=A0A366KDZ6_9BIFI|nr:HAD family phosphatase [Bifidobacterium xylocopae]RBP99930.1 HAD family hydrolase [Bifidobacterium xylocopae]
MHGYPNDVNIEADHIVGEGPAAGALGRPIRHVIFDFGRVLVQWNPAMALISRYSQEHIEALMDGGRSGFYEANDMMDEGVGSEQAVAWVARHHGEPWAGMFRYYIDNMVDSLVGPVPGARKLLEDLKGAGVGVWGLSNWSAETFPLVWDRYEILHMLDGKVVSGYVHMRKPDCAIFRLALERFGIAADDALFVDDRGLNVQGAAMAGIRGLRFEDPYGLRAALIGAGIDIPGVR